MTMALYLVLYLSAATFVAATGVRAAWYARAPIHLRWELYPVPHEPPARAAHGGSRYEAPSTGLAERPNRWGSLKALVIEIACLKALHDFNRPLWRRSFPFHAGLYLLALAAACLIAAAAMTIVVPAVMLSTIGAVVRAVYTLTGAAGLALVIAGATGLLHRRITDPVLRRAAVPGDFFNLAAFVVTLGVLAAGLALRPSASPGPLAIAVGALTWDTGLVVPGPLAAGLGLAALLLAYIPFTHMSHFVGKYFTYHAVRWDDRANTPGGAIERAMAEYLAYRPTWAARHVAADGTRTWVEIASMPPPRKPKP